MRSAFFVVLGVIALAACADLNKPASDPHAYEPPPPVMPPPDAAPPPPPAPASTNDPAPGDVKL